ncbi:helix-turn-helix domain-containing protein [Roseococcus sp. SYP-B2431]|uniref:helix-turn-helix domain-containing protein n=1 Tax=Roseococcus sp. SYP-B2431 TaxID=2496640 RepID=UPI0013F472C1|nr:helix-turn-helix domain-containing protein [Roseococcus sp. SYP-B2431]
MTSSFPTNNRQPLRLLSIATVADLTDLSTKTVRRMITRGDLRVIRVGRQIRVSEDDLSMFLHQRRE